MKIICTIDNNLGIGFNRRRQSRDSVLIADMAKSFYPLATTEYSAPLFSGEKTPFIDLYPHVLQFDGFVFLENTCLFSVQDKISTLVLYRWDKAYPADNYLGVDLAKFTLISQTEFVGSSHNKIIKEIYSK